VMLACPGLVFGQLEPRPPQCNMVTVACFPLSSKQIPTIAGTRTRIEFDQFALVGLLSGWICALVLN
jgi:hypothetical protein